ncbi:hypothetical protein L3049_04310 [Labilibaculum sp. DW002]|uniref:Uncharacterized protein n=1 Tax=Paralabilibaculum antarcticum TaxID=2912572 RepID=A0ABT5VSE5_9BACT|nr:hypothetical protein [Labilibaculum sp. DW002]MDE5417224.1 hypothetical protein [Labilibaculum sp. DW002]
MDTNNDLLNDLLKKEEVSGIYDIKFFGFSLWRIFRFKTRSKYLNTKTGFNFKTSKNKISPFFVLHNCLKSFLSFLEYLLFDRKSIDNIIFAFPRLQKVDEFYFDKLTDPVLEYSNLKDNCLIFQRHFSGEHKLPRYNSERLIMTDAIECLSKFIGLLISPFVLLFYIRTLTDLFKKTQEIFELRAINICLYSFELSNFIIEFYFYNYLFKKKKIKRIFVVNRELCFPVILASKRNGISVYEFQHGVTHGITPLYSGPYNSIIDPDFFLVFGKVWKGPQFGMPLDRILNIGWAYSIFLKKLNKEIKPLGSFSVLLISEPHITEKVLRVAVQLANEYSDYLFHVRLHPQEELNDYHKKIFSQTKNVKIQDNSIESLVSITYYEFILGENSSVVYEALSLGKKVGRLNIGGLNSDNIQNSTEDGFFYISEVKDFEIFCSKSSSILNENVYSKFDRAIIDGLK